APVSVGTTEPPEKLADARAVPPGHVGSWQTPLMTDPVERRRRLVGHDTTNIAQRGLDGICIRDRLPEGAMQIAERREPARIIERVEQVAEARAVAAEVLLHRIGGAETRLGGVE
ncbi:hypothetical protein, partial [Henriciella pelagia]|uniref:hypothetical protein n=1 Tax=Henriciella pelagia TaxID=1977912 RepID=UPI0035191695